MCYHVLYWQPINMCYVFTELESILLVSEFHQEGSDGFDLIFGLSVNSSTHPITLPILPPSVSVGVRNESF